MVKRFFYLVVATAMLLVACEKDAPTSKSMVIEATNVEFDSRLEIASVKAYINTLKQDAEGRSYWESNEIASAKFENGGFKLILPATVPDEYLGSIHEMLSIYSLESVAVSDIQSKTGTVRYICAYNADGERIGDFEKGDSNVEYMYSDRSFTEKGNLKDGSTLDCSFNKGWNIVYNVYDGNNWKSTIEKPSNEDFNWNLSKLLPSQ